MGATRDVSTPRPARRPKRAAVALTVLLLAVLTGACGQKGPLYLPKKTKTVITPAAPTTAPAPAPQPAVPDSNTDAAGGGEPPAAAAR